MRAASVLARKDAIAATLSRRRGEAKAFLASLVRTPSENPPGDCAPHAEAAASALEALGLAVERHPVPAAVAAAHGMRSCTNLIVRERFGPGPIVACNAHGDTAPAGIGWSVDPFAAEVLDNRMYGRGVAVAKSDFATYAFALLALKALAAEGTPLRGGVELHFTHDAERGGALGVPRLLEQGVSRPSFAVCSGFAYGIGTAHSGALQLEIQVLGRTAHASEPDKGVDALHAATVILADLYRLRETYASIRSQVPGIQSPTLVIGAIEGGAAAGMVPDRVVFRLDRHVLPEENWAQVERGLARFIRDVSARLPQVRVTLKRLLVAKPFTPIAGQERLVDVFRANAGEVLQQDIWAHGLSRFTDARHYSAAGIPAILFGAGPRSANDARAYRPDENLRLDDLDRATRIVARSLYDLLAV